MPPELKMNKFQSLCDYGTSQGKDNFLEMAANRSSKDNVAEITWIVGVEGHMF